MQARLLADASRPGEPCSAELLVFIKAAQQHLTWNNHKLGVLETPCNNSLVVETQVKNHICPVGRDVISQVNVIVCQLTRSFVKRSFSPSREETVERALDSKDEPAPSHLTEPHPLV